MAEIFYDEKTACHEEELLIQRFITGMNILRKSIVLYPPGHSTVKRLSLALSPLIEELFDRFSIITINAIKNNLLVNGMLIDTKSAPVHDFALYISHLGIASLTLNRGLSNEELERIYRLTQEVPPKSHIYQCREILNEINSLTSILVREIDLSAVRFIDEDQAGSTEKKKPENIWQKMLLCCLSPELHNTQDAGLLKIIKIYDKDSFNNFIRAFNIPAERMVQGYSTVLRNHFRSASEDEDIVQEKQEFFRSVQKAFDQLEPELKEQILLTTFDAINSSRDEKTVEEFLNCMPGEMVVEVLTQAILNKRIISPALIKLLGILYKAGKDAPASFNLDRQDVLNNPIWKRIEELFSWAGYEKYLSEEYAEQLQNLSLEVNKEHHGGPVGFACEEYLVAFHDRTINRHLTSALLFLMQGNIEEQIYADYAENIARTIPELLEANDYKYLVAIYRSFQPNLDANYGPVINNATQKILDIYAEDSFNTRLIEAYRVQENSQRKDLEELLILNANKSIPWLITEYLDHNKIDKLEQIFSLLCRFGPSAAELALSKLPGKDREETFALLRIIRCCAGERSCPQVRNLLKSKDPEIHLEAVKTLLQAGDPAANPALRNLLRIKVNKTTFKVLQLIHDYKVEEMAHDLANRIKTFYINETTLNYNKTVLALLGSLGATNTLAVLEKKARAKLTLCPHYLQQTKEYLYASLAGYPKPAISDLTEQGLNSGNERVRAICEELAGTTQQIAD